MIFIELVNWSFFATSRSQLKKYLVTYTSLRFHAQISSTGHCKGRAAHSMHTTDHREHWRVCVHVSVQVDDWQQQKIVNAYVVYLCFCECVCVCVMFVSVCVCVLHWVGLADCWESHKALSLMTN